MRYSQGYVGQRCSTAHNCEINEDCEGGMCECESGHWQVGKVGRNHCGDLFDQCVYTEDCDFHDARLECVGHRCKCSGSYHLSTEDKFKCVLDREVYFAIGLVSAVLVVVLITVKLKGAIRRDRRFLLPQQPQSHELSPRLPQPHENRQIPNSEFSAGSEAPPDYKTLFPDIK